VKFSCVITSPGYASRSREVDGVMTKVSEKQDCWFYADTVAMSSQNSVWLLWMTPFCHSMVRLA
jgi:hypothetical protein